MRYQVFKIKDIMTKEVVCVTKETPIFDAIELMRKSEVTGMPVIEEDMTLVGVITEKDVLRLFHSSNEGENQTVAFFMTRPAVSYKENDSLDSICDFMMINYFRRVPVVSKKGKLVGIISRPDIINYIIMQRRVHDQVYAETNSISPAS